MTGEFDGSGGPGSAETGAQGSAQEGAQAAAQDGAGIGAEGAAGGGRPEAGLDPGSAAPGAAADQGGGETGGGPAGPAGPAQPGPSRPGPAEPGAAEPEGAAKPPPAARHLYLVKPGLWGVEGIYLDKDENRHVQTGQLVIVHAPGMWTIDSELTISGADPRTFTSRYEVEPLAPGAAYTEWKSEVGGPEPVYGLFVLVEDAVLMPWQSRSGTYWGQESLLRAGHGVYLSRGFAFLRREKVSSWAVTLTWQGASEAPA